MGEEGSREGKERGEGDRREERRSIATKIKFKLSPIFNEVKTSFKH